MPSPVKFVYIPAHPSDPMEQWEVAYTAENEVECLLDKVKVSTRGSEERATRRVFFFFFRRAWPPLAASTFQLTRRPCPLFFLSLSLPRCH